MLRVAALVWPMLHLLGMLEAGKALGVILLAQPRKATHMHITLFGPALLVEAAAGTGKTALMAGRLTMLLARGTEPGAIAAITFTELAVVAQSEILWHV